MIKPVTREMKEAEKTLPDCTLRAQLLEEFTEGVKGPFVNLGCGNDYICDWVNVDGSSLVNCDVLLNLDDPEIKLPWKDGEVGYMIAFHILEHITNLVPLKHEIARVLRPGAQLSVLVPHFLSNDAWGDDTHVRGFSVASFMHMYWPGFPEILAGEVDGESLSGFPIKWLIGILKKGDK